MFAVAYVYQFHHDLFVRWEANPDFFEAILEWARREDDDDKVAPVLSALARVYSVEMVAGPPTPEYSFRAAHPDPGEGNVFWIQRLIHELGTKSGPRDFVPYLHGTR